MLSYPDRQQFAQIRARWETAPPADNEAEEMVGRRGKQVFQQMLSGEPQSNGGSKFRRKLSHGLAFISNPLSQRKTTPGRHQENVPSLAVTEPATVLRESDAPLSLSPTRKSTPVESPSYSSTKPTTPIYNKRPIKNVDPDATPKALPRSRTLSFIPRPVKFEPDVSATEVEEAVRPPLLAVMSEPKLRAVPSKIPTPSPPLSERSRSSPRQHLPRHTSQQAKYIAAAHAFAGEHSGSPVKAAIRSRTTPNLVKVATSSQPAGFMALKKTALRRAGASPTTLKLVLQENVPTNKRVTQRRFQIQDKTLRRESLAVPSTTISKRRSFGPGAPLRHNTQPNLVTPPTARKHLGSRLAQQTPGTTRRVQSNEPVHSFEPKPSHLANDSTIAQPRLMAPRNISTLSLSTIDLAKSGLLRSNVEKDLQRKTLGTPNDLGGVWQSSRALAVANHEVRTLPRSYTFHGFGTPWDAAPPVPPIPERYRTPSSPNLTRNSQMVPDIPPRPRPVRVISDSTSCESIPEESGENGHDRSTDSSPCGPGRNRPHSFELSNSANCLMALPPIPSTLRSLSTQQFVLTRNSEIHGSNSRIERPWCISECEDSANVDPFLQVKDYMPPLYWAGRFQARIDQWRTEAMMAELNPSKSHELGGPLGKCKLSQEKLAACYILGQLRDLCTSNQAADSLWEFEYKYRKANKLLGNPFDLPSMPSRKDDHSTHKGAFGRAVRKLTPRKTSLVNLLKGKGWNKSEETRPNDGAEQNVEMSSVS